MSYVEAGTIAAGLPYSPLPFGHMDYDARVRVQTRPLDSTDLLAFAREVPTPEPADHTESTEESRVAATTYVREETDETEPADGVAAEAELDPAVFAASSDRRELLARKFARKHMSAEHLARLQILEERLRALAPHVTEDAVARIEQAQERISAADDLLERVRRELSSDE